MANKKKSKSTATAKASAAPAAANKAAPKEAESPAAKAIFEVFDSGNFAAVRHIAAKVEDGNYPPKVVAAAQEAKQRVTIDPVALAIGGAGVLLVVVMVLAALSTPGG